MRRTIAVLILATGALLATSGIARAQFTEQIDGYDVSIELKGRSRPMNQRLGTLVVDTQGRAELLP